jgi:hypothetical protein
MCTVCGLGMSVCSAARAGITAAVAVIDSAVTTRNARNVP